MKPLYIFCQQEQTTAYHVSHIEQRRTDPTCAPLSFYVTDCDNKEDRWEHIGLLILCENAVRDWLEFLQQC